MRFLSSFWLSDAGHGAILHATACLETNVRESIGNHLPEAIDTSRRNHPNRGRRSANHIPPH
jgi:hypothetical protein